ncbi:MAG: TldD/PmbA family protein, partial [Oscillospiraceae bacterium]
MLSKEIVNQVLAKAVSTGADFAEIFMENTQSSNLKVMDGSVQTATTNRIYGVGIRAFKGLKSVYACTNDVTLKGLLDAAQSVSTAIGECKQDIAINVTQKIIKDAHPSLLLPSSVHYNKKSALLKAGYAAMKSHNSEIKQAIAILRDIEQNTLIANSDGLFVEDRRVRTRIALQAIASNGIENQMGMESPGRSMGYELFQNIVDIEKIAKSAAQTAITMLHAPYCKAGKMTVAIESGFGGVIFHEACGHSLEATSVAKGYSEFSGKLGQQIASTKVSAIDDGTLINHWGSTNVDDEGTPAQRKLLIEKGILKSYMIDRLGARRMNLPLTGSGRRESYKFAPTSRMTNTYIDNGDDENETIIASINNGLYAKKMGGGQVNTTTGEFNFAVAEGYLIKNG